MYSTRTPPAHTDWVCCLRRALESGREPVVLVRQVLAVDEYGSTREDLGCPMEGLGLSVDKHGRNGDNLGLGPAGRLGKGRRTRGKGDVHTVLVGICPRPI